jgi:hypothetical protein
MVPHVTSRKSEVEIHRMKTVQANYIYILVVYRSVVACHAENFRVKCERTITVLLSPSHISVKYFVCELCSESSQKKTSSLRHARSRQASSYFQDNCLHLINLIPVNIFIINLKLSPWLISHLDIWENGDIRSCTVSQKLAQISTLSFRTCLVRISTGTLLTLTRCFPQVFGKCQDSPLSQSTTASSSILPKV